MIIIYPLPKNLRVAPTHTLPSLFLVWEPVNSQMWTFEVTDPYPSCATLWTPEALRWLAESHLLFFPRVET